jgi:hypothetical protein
MASLVEPGFAIRRKSCPKGLEVDCGFTGTDGFHACCPSGYTCPGPQYNVVCCLPGADGCTDESLAAAPKPACANATWDMFDNGGFFCCEHGLPGYNKSNMNGCASPKESISGAIQFLSTVRVGVGKLQMLNRRKRYVLILKRSSDNRLVDSRTYDYHTVCLAKCLTSCLVRFA